MWSQEHGESYKETKNVEIKLNMVKSFQIKHEIRLDLCQTFFCVKWNLFKAYDLKSDVLNVLKLVCLDLLNWLYKGQFQ